MGEYCKGITSILIATAQQCKSSFGEQSHVMAFEDDRSSLRIR